MCLFIAFSLSLPTKSSRRNCATKWPYNTEQLLRALSLVFVQTFPQFTALPSGDHHKTDGLILLPVTKAPTQSRGFPNVHVTIWNTTWFGCKCCFHKLLKLSPHLISRHTTGGHGKAAIPHSSRGTNWLFFFLALIVDVWSDLSGEIRRVKHAEGGGSRTFLFFLMV